MGVASLTIIHPMISGCRNFEFHTIIVAKFHIWPDSFYEYRCINMNVYKSNEAILDFL